MKSSRSANYNVWNTHSDLGEELGKSNVGSQDAILEALPPKQPVDNISNDTTTNHDIRNSLISFTYGVMSSFLIAAGTACVQLLEGAVPDFQLTFMRCSFQLLLPLIYFCYRKRLPKIRRKHWLWVFLYCFFVNIFNFTNYMAVNYIAAGVASAIRRSINIVGIAMLAIILLKEKLTLPKIIGVCLSIIGVVTCVQPWLSASSSEDEVESRYALKPKIRNSKNFLRPLFHYIYDDNTAYFLPTSFNETNVTSTVLPDLEPDDGLDEVFGYIMAAVAGVSISFGNILIKFRLQEVSASHLNVYCGAMGTIIPLIISLSTENITFPTDGWDIAYLFGQSTCWGLASVIGVRAMSKGSIVLLTLAFALQIVFLLIAQYTLLSHINPGVGNWVEITGAVLVVISAILPSAWEAIELKLRSTGRCQNGCLGPKTKESERSRAYSM